MSDVERGPDGKFLPKSSEQRVADANTKHLTGEAGADVVDVIDPDARIAQLEEQLAAEKAAGVEKTAQIERLRPTKNVAPFLFNTPEDVVAHYGEQALNDMVKTLIAQENKQRTRQGFDRIVYSEEEFTAKRDEEIAKLLRDRYANDVRPPAEGWLSRTIKMIKPDGTLIQIPYEVQVNNVAGSLADGYVRYERKGYKRTDPMLCPTLNCYEPASIKDAKWEFNGYCTDDHRKRTERGPFIPE